MGSKTKKGFTLIELLAVVTIIALLTAMTLIKLKEVRSRVEKLIPQTTQRGNP